jgi:hypothetical protein
MRNYEKLIDYIYVEKGFYTEKGLSVSAKVSDLIKDISFALGKIHVFTLFSNETLSSENRDLLEKYIENRLDDEYLYLDDYDKWIEKSK